MTDIFRFLTIIILLTISLTAYFLVMGALFPKRTAKTESIINQLPGRSFGLGMVNFLFFGVIVLGLMFLMDGRVPEFLRVVLFFPTMAIAGLLIALSAFGLAGMVKMFGVRIFPELHPLKQTIWGSVILCLACALPFAGWFLLLPCILFTGFGAVILGFFQRDTN